MHYETHSQKFGVSRRFDQIQIRIGPKLGSYDS